MPREVIEVDLLKTGGQLVPPGMPVNLPPPAAPSAPPMPPKTDPPAEAKKDTPPPVIKQCAHCRWPEGVDVVEPTGEEMFAFCKAVWQDGEYAREVTLFNGAVEVTFRALTPTEEDEVQRAVVAAAKTEAFTDLSQAFDLYTDYRLGLALRRLKTGGVIVDRPPDELDAQYPKGPGRLVEIHAAVRAAFRLDPVYRAVRREYTMFFARLGTLQNRALDPSFFPATAAGGPSPASPKRATRA